MGAKKTILSPKPFRRNCLYIYTDGSSLSKPRRGGIGIRYIYLTDLEEEIKIDLRLDGYESGSNNQMELMAVIKGLEHTHQQQISEPYNRIEVRTDSAYVTNNVTNALFSWPRNKWLGVKGRPIENVELWKALTKAIKQAGVRVEIKWVKAHTKGPFKNVDNDAVDKMAKESAGAFLKDSINKSKLRRKKSNLKTKVGSIEMRGQTLAINIITESFLKEQQLSKYRYEVISPHSEFYGKVDIIFSSIHSMKAGHYYLVDVNEDSENPRVVRLISEVKMSDYELEGEDDGIY